jgi:hypothetical protein
MVCKAKKKKIDLFGRDHQHIRARKMANAKAVTIQTSIGDVTLELYWNHAPKSCHNFYELVKRGYYDNTIFHRIIKVCAPPLAQNILCLPPLPFSLISRISCARAEIPLAPEGAASPSMGTHAPNV